MQGVALGVVALGVGCLGEALLFPERGRPLGALLLAMSALLAGLAWGRVAEVPLLTPRVGATGLSSLAPSRRLALRFAGISGALLLWWGGVLAWLANPAAVIGLQGGLWAGSIALFLASCARWYPLSSREEDLGPAWTRAEVALFCSLVGLALFTYLANLNDLPWDFHYDEVLAHDEVTRFVRGPQISLFTTTWSGTGLPSFFFAIEGGLARLAGTELGGVRLGVALAGALTVIPTYGLARLIAGRVAASLAAFALATAPVAVHYSRVSIINMTTAFCWTVCFYFLLRGLRSRRPGDFAWSGLAAGLSMYTYYGTRLLPYLLTAFIAYLALFHFRAFRERAGHLALLGIGFVIGFGPLAAYFIRNPGVWAGRGLIELNVPPALPTSWDSWAGAWNALAPLAWRNFLGLSVLPGGDGVYKAPFLLPVAAALVLLGGGVLVRRWRQPGAFLVLLWGLGVLFVGGTLVSARFVPAFNHWAPAFPAFFIAMALPPALWLESMRHAGRRWWLAGCAVVGLGMAGLAAANAYDYLAVYPQRAGLSFEAAQGRFLATLTPRDRVRFVGNSWQPFYPSIGDMMAPGVPASDFLNPSRGLPLPGDPEHNLVFVFDNDEARYLPLVQSYYPGGVVGPLASRVGKASTYQLPATLAASRHGAILTLENAAGERVWQGQVPLVGNLPAGLTAAYPLTATWSGAFFLPRSGPVRLSIQGGAGAALQVQGRIVAPTEALPLDAGWVPLNLRVTFSKPVDGTPVRLLLEQGEGATAELPTGLLWPQPANTGLAVTLAGSAVTHRIDPFVGAGVLSGDGPTMNGLTAPPRERDPDLLPLAPFASAGGRIRWEGEVYAEGGKYEMNLRTDAHALLTIDGATALKVCASPTPDDYPVRWGDPGTAANITLTPGWHHVRLDLDATGHANGLEWSWTRPDGVSEIVPPSWLRYSSDSGQGEGISWPALPDPVNCAP
ncbi:MAG: glycosyltransferase family 39 protein [Chloroflexia bacterium]